MLFKVLFIFFVLLSLPIQNNAVANSFEKKIWIGPNIASDYHSLFDPDAPWDYVKTHIDVLRYYVGTTIKVSPEFLKNMADVLKSHQIEFAVELGGLRDWQCSGEKMAEIEWSELVPLIRAGVKIDYLSMDGPFGYTTVNEPSNPCQYTVEKAASEIIIYMKAMKQKMPDVKFGWIEPVPWYTVGEYRNHEGSNFGDLKEIVKVFARHLNQSGLSIDHFSADSPYDFTQNTPDGWRKLKELKKILHSYGIRFGVFFNSDGGGHLTNKIFFDETLAGYKKLQQVDGLPDDIMVQSWYSHPDRLLPEDEPYTFMNLIKNLIKKIN